MTNSQSAPANHATGLSPVGFALTSGSFGFYNDAEIYHTSGETDSFSDSSPQQFLAFPTNQIGAYAASLTFDEEGNLNFEGITGRSFDKNPQAYIDLEQPSIQNPIVSPQIDLFWERYREYPSYLKRVKKRARRRNNKKK